MENPNEYNDEEYNRGVEALQEAVADLWNAGASEDNIMDEVANAVKLAQE